MRTAIGDSAGRFSGSKAPILDGRWAPNLLRVCGMGRRNTCRCDGENLQKKLQRRLHFRRINRVSFSGPRARKGSFRWASPAVPFCPRNCDCLGRRFFPHESSGPSQGTLGGCVQLLARWKRPTSPAELFPWLGFSKVILRFCFFAPKGPARPWRGENCRKSKPGFSLEKNLRFR